MPPRKKTTIGISIGGYVATILGGLFTTLIATGIISMIVLYAHVATLTDAELRTEQQLQKHLDHSVDKDEYLRRDNDIQKAIDNMATKEDIKTLRAMIIDLMSGSPRLEKYR